VRKPVDQVPAHWSKDFVEHLRTVHFALIAVSAGLILLVLSARKYDAIVALVQIEEIIDLQKQWSPQWIIERSEKRDPFVRTGAEKNLIVRPWKRKSLRIRLRSSIRSGYAAGRTRTHTRQSIWGSSLVRPRFSRLLLCYAEPWTNLKLAIPFVSKLAGSYGRRKSSLVKMFKAAIS
jgi:hypothetical protein